MKDLATALNGFQSELVTVGKASENPFFKSKYADLATIMQATQPILVRYGLAVVQLPSSVNGQPALKTIIMHTSGESIEATTPLLMSKQDPQGLGSAITYMRRYAYAAALQIVIDEDDDGNRASTPKSVQTASKKPYQNPQASATDKQKQLIVKILKEQGVALEEQSGYMVEQYGVEMPLTAEGASFVIEQLIN